MSLFDEPVSAHIGEDAVLWVGVVEGRDPKYAGDTSATLSQAIVVNAKGRVGLAPIQELTADWRWVPERAVIRGPEVSGPGWVDLEEYDNPYVPAVTPEGPSADDIEAAKTAAVKALILDKPAPEARDFLIGADGTKFDPSTNLPVDE